MTEDGEYGTPWWSWRLCARKGPVAARAALEIDGAKQSQMAVVGSQWSVVSWRTAVQNKANFAGCPEMGAPRLGREGALLSQSCETKPISVGAELQLSHFQE